MTEYRGLPSLPNRQGDLAMSPFFPQIAEEDLHIHHRIWRSRGGPDTADNLELLHANCHRQIHVQERLTKAAASCEGRS